MKNLQLKVTFDDKSKINTAIYYSYYAIKGKDYEQISRLISKSSFSNGTTVISIPIINDDLAEGLEHIGGRLEIINPPTNSTASTITIEIIDDEGMCTCKALG